MTSRVDAAATLARVRGLARSGAARSIRLAAGLTLPEAARACGVSPSTVWRWEAGQRRPMGRPALLYAELLDVLMRGGRS